MIENPLNIVDETFASTSDFYTVIVDEKRLRDFFLEFGVNNDDIESTEFILTNKGPDWFGLPGEGAYSSHTNELELGVDHLWKMYLKKRTLSEELVCGNKKPKKRQFKGMLHTERLSGYLANHEISLKRRLAFADKLLVNATNRQFNRHFFHEAKHLIDAKTHPNIGRTDTALTFTGLIGGAAWGWYFNNTLPTTENVFLDISRALPTVGLLSYCGLATLNRLASPGEWRAIKFEKDISKNPEWRNIFTLVPDLEWRSVKGIA